MLHSTAFLLLAAVVVGLFWGATGVGGILMVPLVKFFGAMDIHESVATVLFAFIFVSIQATWLYARHGSVDWKITLPVCVGSVFSGAFGAWLNSIIDARPLTILIAVLVIVAGLSILRHARAASGPHRDGRSPNEQLVLLAVGAAAGLGSGLTGAGGALYSVPLMLLLGFPVLKSAAAGQVLAIVSCTSASVGNLAYGTIDFAVALWIVPALFLGMWVGVKVAHRARIEHLKRFVAGFCILLGALMLYGIR